MNNVCIRLYVLYILLDFFLRLIEYLIIDWEFFFRVVVFLGYFLYDC